MIPLDNGDPLHEEGFDSPSRKPFNGKCLVILKSTGKAGAFTLLAESDRLANAQLSLQTR
ncbi:MAG: hypothetical protein HUJ21_23335 [Cyclobacterium sp.]|nr:hypothetical protein [Cyclobacterium sp.]